MRFASRVTIRLACRRRRVSRSPSSLRPNRSVRGLPARALRASTAGSCRPFGRDFAAHVGLDRPRVSPAISFSQSGRGAPRSPVSSAPRAARARPIRRPRTIPSPPPRARRTSPTRASATSASSCFASGPRSRSLSNLTASSGAPASAIPAGIAIFGSSSLSASQSVSASCAVFGTAGGVRDRHDAVEIPHEDGRVAGLGQSRGTCRRARTCDSAPPRS